MPEYKTKIYVLSSGFAPFVSAGKEHSAAIHKGLKSATATLQKVAQQPKANE
jgi:hypothetical protein